MISHWPWKASNGVSHVVAELVALEGTRGIKLDHVVITELVSKVVAQCQELLSLETQFRLHHRIDIRSGLLCVAVDNDGDEGRG